jgi:tRNA(Ile)-lysidine synthase TilS/MesJ
MQRQIPRYYDEHKEYLKICGLFTSIDTETIRNTKRDIVILFSGGLDSAVLVHLIGTYLKDNNIDKPINLVVIKNPWHDSRFQQYSQQAIDLLIYQFKQEGIWLTVSYNETIISLT